jgi:uncharacterized membrane protein
MNNSMMNRLGNTLEGSLMQHNDHANVGKSERVVSLGTGAFIALKGITNLFSHPMIALTELGVGGALLYRGVTGNCPIKEKLENQSTDSKNMQNVDAQTTANDIERSNPTVPY